MEENLDTSEEYAQTLRWRIELFKYKLENGELKFAPHLADDIFKSFSKIKADENGEIDINTVDSRIRSLALGVAAIQNREDAKNHIGLSDIQNQYFEYIQKNFETFIEIAETQGLNAQQVAYAASQQDDIVKEISTKIFELVDDLEEFWGSVSKSADYHIQDLEGLKSVYGGDLFPSYKSNIASSVGLYIDTIILTEPFMQSKRVFSNTSPQNATFYAIKHAVSVMQYRDLALAIENTPIVAITPFRSMIDQEEAKFVTNSAEFDAVKLANEIFGTHFDAMNEVMDFCSGLSSVESVVDVVSNPDRILFDTEWDGALEDQIRQYIKDNIIDFDVFNHPGQMIAGQCFGRMMQATDLLFKSKYLCGTPLLDAPTSWEYFKWKLGYNAAVAEQEHLPMHMVRGLQRAAETDMEWLGKIPSNALIEMRMTGAFEEIRNVLANGVEDIAIAKPDAFFRSSDQIVQNIQDAFEQHKSEIVEIREKGIKFAGQELGSWVVGGAVELASIISGSPVYGTFALAMNQVVDAPKLKEIPGRLRELRDGYKEIKKSPMGLFFAHK